MSRKVYQQKNQFSNSSAIRISVKGISKTVVFESKRKNGILTLETNAEDVQNAIEATDKFKTGQITCIEGPLTPKGGQEPISPPKSGINGGEQEYPEVTEWQAAKELLRSEPYNIPFQSLNTPVNILKKAEEVGVSFPNLKAE